MTALSNANGFGALEHLTFDLGRGREDEVLVERLVGVAKRGLGLAYHGGFMPQTVRGVAGPHGPRAVPEGVSLRYSAIAALGLARLGLPEQRLVLGGDTAATLTRRVAGQAIRSADTGVLALAAWAQAEVAEEVDHGLLDGLRRRLSAAKPMSVVELSWILTAAVASGELGHSLDLARAAAERLREAQGPAGAFGHVYPYSALPRYRRHVGSFADQIYPVQALARWSRHAGAAALAAANRGAEVVVEHQGEHGQWWWHYDRRDGSVVEGFPVYSVHQHGMAPMVLGDLAAAGGTDHREAVTRGLRWIGTHPEVVPELVDERLGVVWRKVGRRERHKLVRGLAAATTAIRPGLTPPGLDRLAPAVEVDLECRPYELGWLLYSWGTSSEQGDRR